MSETRREEEDRVKASLLGFAETWLAGRLDEMMRLWDAEAPEELSYVCVDKDEPILGREAIQAYFDNVAQGYSVLHAEMLNPLVRFVGEDTAYAICHYVWGCRVGTFEFTTRTRANFVLRKRGNRWHYQHMHESVKWGGPV